MTGILTTSSDNKPKPLVQGNGFALYNFQDLFSIRAKDKYNNDTVQNIQYTNAWYTLSPYTCLEIFKSVAPIYSSIDKGAKIFSSLPFKVLPMKKVEDEFVFKLRHYKFLYENEENDLKRIIAFSQIYKVLKNYAIKRDLSNFELSLRQYIKNLRQSVSASSSEVEDWIMKPRSGNQYQDFAKQYYIDNRVHGRNAIKIPNESFDGYQLLPGGSVYPIPERYIGEQKIAMYVQMSYNAYGWDTANPARFFTSNDISVSLYSPNSAITAGSKPFDAIVSEVMTYVNTKGLLLENSNNEKPLDYLIFVLDDGQEMENITGMNTFDPIEQERMEEGLNQKQKDKFVKIVSQKGKGVQLFNLSKENLISILAPQEENLMKVIYSVLNVPPSEDALGQSFTAQAGVESLKNIYYSSSINPDARALENQMTYEILPYRFRLVSEDGSGLDCNWDFKLAVIENEDHKLDLASKAKSTQVLTDNEIRTIYLDVDPVASDSADRLPSEMTQPQPTTTDIMNAIKGKSK